MREDGALLWSRADRPSRLVAEISRDSGLPARRHRPGAGRDATLRPHRRDQPQPAALRHRPPLPDPRGRPRRPPALQRGGHRPAADRARSRRRRPLPVVRRHRRAGLGRQPGPRRLPDRRRDARAPPPTSSSAAATTSTPTARSSSPCRCPTARTWRNLTTPEKSKVAETLDEFRGQFRYNLLADNWRAFLAETAQVIAVGRPRGHQQLVPGRDPATTPGTPRSGSTCSRPGPHRAFHEYLPVAPISPDPEGRVYRVIQYGPLLDVFVLDMRTHKDPNTANRETDR